MELICTQTQINVTFEKKKSIYIHCLDFDMASREGPAGHDGPPLCKHQYQQSLITTIVCLKLLPLLSGGASIFEGNRWIHRAVTLHGDTAGSRGVCSLLPPSEKQEPSSYDLWMSFQ